MRLNRSKTDGEGDVPPALLDPIMEALSRELVHVVV
jgi:hypothetical protein